MRTTLMAFVTAGLLLVSAVAWAADFCIIMEQSGDPVGTLP